MITPHTIISPLLGVFSVVLYTYIFTKSWGWAGLSFVVSMYMLVLAMFLINNK